MCITKVKKFLVLLNIIWYFLSLSLKFLLFTFLFTLGRFVFAYDTSIAFEGSNATFTCQDTERNFPLRITWSFQSASVRRTICENGSIASGINEQKYQLLKPSTKLRITDLKVNDTGKYTCCIEGENGETLLSATANLHVKGKLANPFFMLLTNVRNVQLCQLSAEEASAFIPKDARRISCALCLARIAIRGQGEFESSYFEITNRYKGVVHIVQEQCLNTVEHYLNWMLGS